MKFIVEPIKLIIDDPDRDCIIFICNCNSEGDCKAKDSCAADEIGIT